MTRLRGCRPLGEPRQGRAHLASNAEDDEIAGKLPELCDEFRRRRAHHLFEVLDVTEAIGK